MCRLSFTLTRRPPEPPARQIGEMRWLMLGCLLVTAMAGTVFVREPFSVGWTNGTRYFTFGKYKPAIAYNSVETPQYVLRLQNDAPMMQVHRQYSPSQLLNSSGIEFVSPQPLAYGLDVSFSQAQWGGGGWAGDGEHICSFSAESGTGNHRATSISCVSPRRFPAFCFASLERRCRHRILPAAWHHSDHDLQLRSARWVTRWPAGRRALAPVHGTDLGSSCFGDGFTPAHCFPASHLLCRWKVGGGARSSQLFGPHAFSRCPHPQQHFHITLCACQRAAGKMPRTSRRCSAHGNDLHMLAIASLCLSFLCSLGYSTSLGRAG